MNGARDQLLAHAALAKNQHRRIRRRRFPNLIGHLRQRGTAAHHFVPVLER
ncbi:hypothetical protein D3C83_303780 [compost metagenome]